MAIYKPPKLKNAKEFLTDKKVNRSSPEEYYEVTSQKFSLYDPDTAYSGSQRAKQEKESERRLSLPKVNLQELRDNSINQFTEYLPQEEVSRLNRIAHQREQPKQSLMEKLTSNVTDENRATLGAKKKLSAPRINSQVATLAGKQPEQYSQQQSAEGDRFLSDGNIKGQVENTELKKESEPIDWGNQLRGAGRSLIDLPRNIGAAAVNTYDNLRKSGVLPGGAQKQKVLTEEEFNNSNALTKKGYGTYENYLKLVGGLNESPQFASSEKTDKVVEGLQEKLPSKVDSDTTLWEKMVRGAATSWIPSMASASLGGGLAGMAGQFSSNPIIIEAMRTAPLFTSGTDSGLKTAEELGLTGAKKYSYAVLSGLLEAGTERLSSLGLEGKLLGKKTAGGVGGTREFLRAIFEESGSEMLNEVGQQLLTGQYTNYEDFELDFENIIVAGGSAALMGGFGAVGELSNGLKYRTVGTVDNQVIIETEDGRRENVNPEIVMRHQLANGRTARRAQEMLKADTEIQELAKSFGEQEQTADTMPVEDTTTPQEAFKVETKPSMPIEEKPLTEPLNEQKEDKVARERGSNIENLKVDNIGVDAKRFQFKEATDSNTGAGTSLQGTDTFNPNLAGVVTVWRDNNGKDWIINGHHRLELARRSNTDTIDARILYESDGVTESLARQIGAEQNIAEGKGSAKDAAQIFRESGYTVKELAELGLSIKDKFIEQAYNISKLNDRLWDKVVTKQLKENQASMIGEAFPNDSDKQNAVMDYINEEGYITDKELKEVIDGVRFSETNYEEQYTLMGLETVAKSNFKEKVKLTTKIKQSIGSEKSAFSKLVKAQSAKKIEDAGNILNQEANESRLDLLQNINEIIDFGKNRQGDPINIIINKYANEVQNGAKLNFAADKAIEEITAIVQDGGYIALAMKGIEEQSNQQMMIGDEFNETQQDEPGDVQGINQDSERREEIEGQGSLFDITESENTTAEEVILSNNMDIEPIKERIRKDYEIEPDRIISNSMESFEYGEDIERIIDLSREVENAFVGLKESKSKETMLESTALSGVQKKDVVEPNPMKYVETTNEIDGKKAYSRVMENYEKAYNEVNKKMIDGELLSPMDIATVDILVMRADEMFKISGNTEYLDHTRVLLDNCWKFRSRMGQSFQAMQMIKKLSREGAMYILTRNVNAQRSQLDIDIIDSIERELDKVIPKEAEAVREPGPEIPEPEIGTVQPTVALPKLERRKDESLGKEIDKIIEADKKSKIKLPSVKEAEGPQRAEGEQMLMTDVFRMQPKAKEGLGWVNDPLEPGASRPPYNPTTYATATTQSLLNALSKREIIPGKRVGKKWLNFMDNRLKAQPLTTEEIMHEFYMERARMTAIEKEREANRRKPPKFKDSEIAELLNTLEQYKPGRRFMNEINQILKTRGMTRTEILEKFYAAKNIPNISEFDKAQIDFHIQLAKEYEIGSREYNINMNAASDLVSRAAGTDFWKQLRAVRIMSLLSSPVTGVRNEVGNIGTGLAIKTLESRVESAVDRNIAKKTGKRTTNNAVKFTDYVNGLIEGYKISYQDLRDGTDSRTVEGKLLGMSQANFKKGGIADRVSDYIAFNTNDFRNYNAHMAQMDFAISTTITEMRSNKQTFGEVNMEGYKTYDEAYEAHLNEAEAIMRKLFKEKAMEYTFNNNTWSAQLLADIVRKMNLHTPFIKNENFGAGSLMVAFARTPMNLVDFMVKRLPVLSALPTGAELVSELYAERSLPKPERGKVLERKQQRIADTLAKQTTGMMLTALGMAMGAGGWITNDEEDEKVKKLLEAQGIKGSYLNLGAMKRWLFSGGGTMMPYEGQYQDGDKLISFNWAIPISPFLLFGARIQQKIRMNDDVGLTDAFDFTLEALGDSTGDFFEMPFMRALGTIFNSNIPRNQKLGKLANDFVIGFIPSLLKAGARAFDPYTKDTPYAGKGSLTANVKASLPGLRNTLPNRYDISGEAMGYYEPTVMNRLLSFVNPAYVSKVEQNDDIDKILNAYADGTISELPADKKNTFKYNGTAGNIKKGSYKLEGESYGYYKKRYLYHFANTKSPNGLSFNSEDAGKKAQEDVIREFKLKPILPKPPQAK